MQHSIDELSSQYLNWSGNEIEKNIKEEILSLSFDEKNKLFGSRLEFGTAGAYFWDLRNFETLNFSNQKHPWNIEMRMRISEWD